MVLLVWGPAPGDAPAHLYRTFLVRHSIVLWDNLWYAGHYPLASYSLLYYLPAAVVGNRPLVFAAAVGSALLFVTIAFHEWGAQVRWATRSFSVLAAAPLFTGLYSYALGFLALLAAVRALQRNRAVLFAVLAAITLGFSPLAFVFLLAIVAAVALARGSFDLRRAMIGGALGLLVAFEFGVLVLFPTKGDYPFDYRDMICIVGVCVLGAALSRRAPGSRVLFWLFVVWGVGGVATFLIPSAIGDNWTRLRAFVFPLMLVAAIQARFKPRLLVGVAIAAAVGYNLVPYAMLIPYRTDGRPATAAFWRPAIRFLEREGPPLYRIEVVPTAAHWESYWLPRAGYALARGWYRQLDESTNPVLYSRHLTAAAYGRWLRQMSVRFVIVPRTTLDPDGAPTEERIVTSGSLAGVYLVFTSPTMFIYRVEGTRPLLTGASRSTLVRFDHAAISGNVGAPGTYELRVRYNPYWEVSPSTACVERGPASTTSLRLRTAGTFTLREPSSFEGIVESLIGRHAVCRSG